MRWCPGDAGPGRRIQYSTVQYSTAQHMIYHTIPRYLGNKTRASGPSRSAKPNNSNQSKPRAKCLSRQAGWME